MAIDTPDLIIFAAASIYLAFKKADPGNKEYSTLSPFEVRLDHIALACETEEELYRVAKKLTDTGVENTGVKLDVALTRCSF